MSADTPSLYQPKIWALLIELLLQEPPAQLETNNPAILSKTERWETVEPRQGIEDVERMVLIRDDIDSRIRPLLDKLSR